MKMEKMQMIDRDFETNPITPQEAIELFFQESSDLAIASLKTLEAAAWELEREGFFHAATDIQARWQDYQEELRVMLLEFM
jgi:hypothetical protein